MNFSWVFTLLVAVVSASNSTKSLLALSLLTCMDNSQVWSSYFDVVYYPSQKVVNFDIQAVSNINGVNVTATIQLIVYGLKVLSQDVDLCDLSELLGICPLTSGHLDISYKYDVPSLISNQIPGVAFTIPDIDARVRINLNNKESGAPLACVEATVTNGKTVQTKYAAWPIAAISGLGVITSGVISVIGHSSTAAHIASNSMSLFVYFQSLAITSMLAVAKAPPIAAAWAQNFQWSLGVIRTAFIQDIANWYLQSTGGTPTNILGDNHYSISVQKRSFDFNNNPLAQTFGNPIELAKRAITLDTDHSGLSDRLNSTLYTTNEKEASLGTKVLVLRGIQRVAYLAHIEITNLYMTTTIFLLFFAFLVVAVMTFFKAIIEICIRSKMMNEGKFLEYRLQWLNIIKGAMFRLLVVSMPQVLVLGLWELTVHDSAGIVVVAVFLIIVNLGLLVYAAAKVILRGRRSVRDHKNAAYLLYGDGRFLNKFGFVYVQYRADCYYFLIVTLAYVLFKTLFVAVLQSHGRVQAVIVFVIELAFCVAVCWIRPYMDKRTNGFNITISVINTINALFFMFFSYVFGQPQVVAAVMGVVYFVLNAAFALFLLIFTIVTCTLALVYKNPDTRYQPMKDDRVSFLPRMGAKSNKAAAGQDDIELVALGASAMKGHEHARAGEPYADSDSFYDEDSTGRRAAFNSAYADKESLSKGSLVDSELPQEPTLTIVGNLTNAYQNFQTNYQGSENQQYKGFYDRKR